jgi:hypothetical protein
VNPDIHPALAHVIDRALAPASEDRFGDAAEMEEALQRVSATLGLDPSTRALGTFVASVLGTGGAEAAAEVPRTLVAAPKARRRRTGWVWMPLLLLAVAIAGGVWIMLQSGPAIDTPPPPSNPDPAPVVPVAEEPRPADAGIAAPADTDRLAADKPGKKPRRKKRRIAAITPGQPDAGGPPEGGDPLVKPPPVEAEPGFRLRTNREAFYSMDGGPEQPAPLILEEELRGVHLLKIRDREGLSATVRIEVKGDRGNVKLAFRSSPYAILRIDGRPKGLTPIAEISVGRGTHVMTLAVPKSRHVLVLNMEIR